MLRLQAGDMVLELAPEVGGSIAAFYRQAGAVTEHWLRPAAPEALNRADPLGLASFPLLPWCNRLRDGRAQALGRRIVLPAGPAWPHALHGLGWRRPWQVLQAQADLAELALQHTGPLQPGWPWAFSAWQRLRVRSDGLDCEMRLRNDSNAPMPCGLGHHPYFPHTPGTRLQCRVQAMWASDAERLPTELQQPAFLPRLAQGLTLAELDLDNNFIGWDHRFRVSWPGRSEALVLTAQPPLDFFVLYCPRGLDHFCAEPVSNCTDWLNLAGPREAVGGEVLGPGESLLARWALQLEPGH